MDQKTTVNFQGLSLTKEAIDAMDLAAIQKLKSDSSSNRTQYSLAGCLVLLGAMVVLPASSNSELSRGLATSLPLFTLAGIVMNGRKKKVAELDLIEYIKTGNIDNVVNEDTPDKAKKSGLKIG